MTPQDVETARLRHLLHVIAAQTDPRWSRELARMEQGSARGDIIRGGYNNRALAGVVERVIKGHAGGVAPVTIRFAASLLLGRVIERIQIQEALSRLHRAGRIRIRHRKWHGTDDREAGP